MTVIDAATGSQTRIRHPDIPAIRMLDTPIGGVRAWWSAGSETVYFVDIDRSEKIARVIAADAKTGETREAFAESTQEGYLELRQSEYKASVGRRPSC